MERKFKVTIGDKTVIVKVEEIMEAEALMVQRTITKPRVIEKTRETPMIAITELSKQVPIGEGIVRAPMPGVILSIECKLGDKVEAGDILLMLEAMKMENAIYAPKSGIITKIVVSEKQNVKYGEILLEFS
ncbi:acetyl-CoA carboxylase biotin carboxyl carrier protein subunit [Candidatus Bathyarchaeota archaeon]|nr:acetyl-CoA carboxylase biotin carboxyl carrier protein subunit [Candidatus Bathyarchaeota archaeon]